MSSIICVPAMLTALAVFAWCIRKLSFPTWIETAQKIGVWVTGKKNLAALNKRLEVLQIPITAELFIAIRTLVTFLPILIGFVLILCGHTGAVILFPAALLIKRVVSLFLTLLEKRRKEALLRDFPLLLEQLKIFAKTVGYYHAFKIAAKSIKGVLGKELALLSAEMEMLGLIKAINNFADRSCIPEFKDFARIIVVEESTGADISKTLLNYATMIRQKQLSRIKRKIKLQPIIMSILPGFLIVLLMIMFIVPLITNIVQQLSSI